MSFKEVYSILGVNAYLFCALLCIGYSIGNHAWVTLIGVLALAVMAFPLAKPCSKTSSKGSNVCLRRRSR